MNVGINNENVQAINYNCHVQVKSVVCTHTFKRKSWLFPASLTSVQDPGWWIGVWKQNVIWGRCCCGVGLRCQYFCERYWPFCHHTMCRTVTTLIYLGAEKGLRKNRFNLRIVVKTKEDVNWSKETAGFGCSRVLSGWQGDRFRDWYWARCSLSLKTAWCLGTLDQGHKHAGCQFLISLLASLNRNSSETCACPCARLLIN